VRSYLLNSTGNRLEYIMLLKFPIILSSNSFLFHLLFPFLFFFVSVLSQNQFVYNDTTCIIIIIQSCLLYPGRFCSTRWSIIARLGGKLKLVHNKTSFYQRSLILHHGLYHSHYLVCTALQFHLLYLCLLPDYSRTVILNSFNSPLFPKLFWHNVHMPSGQPLSKLLS